MIKFEDLKIGNTIYRINVSDFNSEIGIIPCVISEIEGTPKWCYVKFSNNNYKPQFSFGRGKKLSIFHNDIYFNNIEDAKKGFLIKASKWLIFLKNKVEELEKTKININVLTEKIEACI